MVALLMMEILDFTTIEEKNEFLKFELQKFHERQNDRRGRYTLAHLHKTAKKLKLELQDPKK